MLDTTKTISFSKSWINKENINQSLKKTTSQNKSFFLKYFLTVPIGYLAQHPRGTVIWIIVTIKIIQSRIMSGKINAILIAAIVVWFSTRPRKHQVVRRLAVFEPPTSLGLPVGNSYPKVLVVAVHSSPYVTAIHNCVFYAFKLISKLLLTFSRLKKLQCDQNNLKLCNTIFNCFFLFHKVALFFIDLNFNALKHNKTLVPAVFRTFFQVLVSKHSQPIFDLK